PDALIRDDCRLRLHRGRPARPHEPCGHRVRRPPFRRPAGWGFAHADQGWYPARADRRPAGDDPAVPGRQSGAPARTQAAGRESRPRDHRDDHQDVCRRGSPPLMDAVIQALYSIPVAGLVFQLAGYLVNIVPAISPLILQAATPIALAALCGVMCERAGVVNIGIEGIMITAAFVGWYTGVLLVPVLGTAVIGPFGMNPALVVAL